MIGVDLIGQIRRAYFEQHRPIKEIVRTLSVSRATVRKVIRSQATAFKYERGIQPVPKLGEWVEVLTEVLEKEAKLPRRERRSTQRLFEELRGRGYDGAHDSVHRFVKTWRNERARFPAQAFVPIELCPRTRRTSSTGSREAITLQGLPLTIKAAHMKLSGNRNCPSFASSPGRCFKAIFCRRGATEYNRAFCRWARAVVRARGLHARFRLGEEASREAVRRSAPFSCSTLSRG